MKLVVQRVISAAVRVDGAVVGSCGPGFLILCGAGQGSGNADAVRLADRVAGMRVFNDEAGKMNLGLADLPESGLPQALVVSNFTLYGEPWSSRRPSFIKSAGYEEGELLYKIFVSELSSRVRGVETGVFGAHMEIDMRADGPVTMLLEAHGGKTGP